MPLVSDRKPRLLPPAPHSLQGLVLATLLPQPLRLVALTGVLKTGLAGKGRRVILGKVQSRLSAGAALGDVISRGECEGCASMAAP